VQNLLNEQNSEIIFLKSQVTRQNLDIVGYRVRITQLEAALRELSTDWDCCVVSKNMKLIARKALEGKDD
ncbi:hypothetical protein UFOVP1465_56, partial [uncultured Caudovirales phage]